MRVLYIARGYTPHDHRFLAALAQTDYEMFFLQLAENDNRLEDRPIPPQIRRVRLHKRLSSHLPDWRAILSSRMAFRKMVHTLQPDLVHAGPIQQGAFLAALSGFHPLVSMSWGSDLLKDASRNPYWHKVTRFTLSRSDVFVGDCQAVAEEAVSYGVPEDKIVLFPWGVDLQRFYPGRSHELIQRLGWKDCFILLCVRSWEPIYGVDHLLRGFVEAAQHNPSLRLVLLGGGSLAPLLRSILIQAGMLDRVHFAGQVRQDDLLRYYQAADLYVSASHSDGSSVSLMEALACGLPALVSDIPGNREWVQPGVQGWLFTDGDEQQIAADILHALDLRERTNEMRKASRTLAEKRADWSQNFKQLLCAYEMALTMRSQDA